MDATDRIRRQFEARHETFDHASSWATAADLIGAIVDALDARSHQVLDVCCGTGIVGEALAALGNHVVGVDLSPHMLAIAATRLPEVVVADAAEMPFPDGSFERIVLRQAWHFVDPHRVSRELLRVATPGAVLVTAQIVPWGAADAEHQERIHRAKQPDLAWFATEAGLAAALAEAGWTLTATRELFLEEEIGAWLRHAPETGDRVPEVVRLIREAPEPYRKLHRIREAGDKLRETFRWVVITARKAGAPPGVEPGLLSVLECPACRRGGLEPEGDGLQCVGCHARYPVDAGVPRIEPPRAE